MNRTDKRKRRKMCAGFTSKPDRRDVFFFFVLPLVVRGVSCVEKAFARS